ncbi:amidohydrolase family protein [Nocardioides bigeumensis]|uniref:Amidohydrolase family protein n=2 Tax=Nocardioides bigeumensis TaxID=433657 RepID=A0ABN2XNV2_9ACTN
MEQTASMHAIRAAHAFDGERFLQGGATVLVEGDRIIGVEPGGFEVPEGVELTSYDGTLLPGLVDAHVHLVSDGEMGSLERAGTLDDDGLDAMIEGSLRAQAAAGVTTVRDLGDVGFRTLAWRDRAEPGLPRIVAAGPPLTTPGGHCHYLGGEVEGVAGMRAAVAAHAARGVDVIKVMASGGMLTLGSDVFGVQFTAEELRAAVDAAHDAGLRLLAHAHSLAGIEHALAAGADGIEHFSCLTENGPSWSEDLLARVAEAGVVVGPTHGQLLDRLPTLEQLPPAIVAVFEKFGMRPDEMRARRMEVFTRVRAHGIPVCSGLDAGAAPPKPHGALWSAVDWLADAYPVDEALATATSFAAEQCGLGAETGRLRASYAADLLVVDGDLSRDVKRLSQPVAVWVRGLAQPS